MAVFQISLMVLALAMLASANPATLQGLYGTPHEGDHEHGHEHGRHHHASGPTDVASSGFFSAGSGSLGTDSISESGSLSDSDPSRDSTQGSRFTEQSGNGQQSSGRGSETVFDRFQQTVPDSVSGFGSSASLSGSLDSSAGRSFGLAGTSGSVPTGAEIQFALDSDVPDVTVTQERTIDVFKTVTNVFYNSVPVTLTEFMKTTVVAPTLQVLSTPVDDHVFVATAPVTRTDTITVTDTNTAFQCATEVSTDFYTVTHRAYDIQQQVVSSTIVQTQVLRPTVVRTLITTELDTQVVTQTVFNTVVVEPRTVSTIVGGAGAFRRAPQNDQFLQQSSQQRQFVQQQQDRSVQSQIRFDQNQLIGQVPAGLDRQGQRQFGQQQTRFNQFGQRQQGQQQPGQSQSSQQEIFQRQQAEVEEHLRRQQLAAERMEEDHRRERQRQSVKALYEAPQ